MHMSVPICNHSEEIMNKKSVIAATLLAAAALPFGREACARVNVDINIGQPAPVIVAPMPPPPPPHRRIYIERRPEFIYTPALGFSVSVGSPYDVVYYGNRYYVYDDGGWYWASSHNGPWVYVDRHRLPDRIRRYRYEEIRRYRDEEYRRHDRGPDRGRDRDWHDRDRDWRDRDRHDNGRWH